MTRAAALFSTVVVLLAQVAQAGQSGTIDGPPAPVPPDIIARDASTGKVTLRAVRLTAPLRRDGRLDEAIYSSVPAISDFIQQEPVEGSPATEKTEVWLFFDRDALYVSFRNWESQPDAIVANEMRRDNNNVFQNDGIAFLIDTFLDRRNGVEFAVTPIGGRWDGQITNERQFNSDWNPVWDVKVGRFEGGWTVEAAIPFKSLRYSPGLEQTWGFNARRINKEKNETSYIVRIPAALGQRGLFQASLAPTLVGLEAPPASRNLEIKPYGVSSMTSDRRATPAVSNDLTGDVGLDLKYGLTPNVTADFTYNTDFAQVEADEQQVNLTRFSLFFPEKREFFLENQGLFGVGGIGGTSAGDTPILFYSRRIGFNQGRAVPIEAGGRVTGRVGRYNIGILSIESGDERLSASPRTNFSVVRVKRDILRRSSIGVMFTGRSVTQGSAGANLVYGLDGTFAFFDNLSVNTYWARTHTDGDPDDSTSGTSYRAQLDYAGDRYGLQLERLVVGSHFSPGVGYVRRNDIRKSSAFGRFSPRPRTNNVIRRVVWSGSMAYVENEAGRLDARDWRGELAVEFHNSDRLSASYGGTYEFVPQPVPIVGITLPEGGYDYATTRAAFTFGQQRKLSGNVSLEHGEFYSGHKTSFTIGQGRLNLSPQLSLEPTYTGNWVDLAEGASTTHLAGSRVVYTMTPAMFASALVQYHTGSDTVSANVRLRWEYRPGSELFVVYNEQRDTLSASFPELTNRAVIVKVNRLLRF